MFETKSQEQVLQEVNSNLSGLTPEEAAKRLQENGENVLLEAAPPTKLQMFFAQLNDPLIYILLAAAVISIFLKEYSDAVIIGCVVLLNAVVGVIQEGKAQRALEALKKISSPFAVVRRGGAVQEIPAAQLVQGDIVLLEAGRIIPADLRLLSTVNLKIEESALTGESVPVEKQADSLAAADATLGDRHNMAYMSTAVSYGRGEGVVVATGEHTEIGKIAMMLGGKEPPTPLQKRLAELSKLLGILALTICAAMFVIALLQGRDLAEMLITAISLAVAAVPEGLPAVVTIVLAFGVQRMVKVNSIVRRLPAVETLGAVSTVCSDKTGTLTQNKMTVLQVYVDQQLQPVDQLAYPQHKLFLDGFTLCTDASLENGKRLGDPTELALLDMAAHLQISRPALEADAPRINEQAFDSGRKLMTTVHKTEAQVTAYTKGAVDRLLPLCSQITSGGQTRAITAQDQSAILAAASTMAESALRVLALAIKLDNDRAEESALTFVGLVGMIDPPRPEAREAVANFCQAGVTTVMITGDHQDTAFAIAKELGIAESPEQCLSGSDLNAMSQEELEQRVCSLRVFARVSPEHKVRIVRALQANNQVVSMTGDGVNDAPSLEAADIGVAMGISGTDVAKSAAAMVLTDDNFATIEKAIEEGRGIYENIRKTVLFLLSSNLGEVISMFAAIAVGLASPLRAVHILWVNLITDSLPALALGADTKPQGIMEQPPRSIKAGFFSDGGYFITIFYGLLIAAMTLTAFLYPVGQQLLAAGKQLTVANFDLLLTGDLLTLSQTYAFTVLAVSQLFHSIGMRNTRISIFNKDAFRNKMMIFAFGAGLLLQILATEIPFFNVAFTTTHLTVTQWGELLLFCMLPLLCHEIIVLVNHLRSKK